MDRKEHLLIILAEECAELQQIVAKTLRFGINGEIRVDTNEELMIAEFNDILAMVEMLKEEGFNLERYEELIDRKKKKVEDYLKLSKIYGTLNE